MDRARFRLQAVVVLALVVLVSWPQMRPVRATSIWRANPLSEPQEEVAPDRRFDYGGEKRARIGYGSLATQTDADPNTRRRNDLPGVGEDMQAPTLSPPAEAIALGARLNAIIGRARTNLNQPVPYARVILRNLITGQIESRATADAEGRFTFIDIGASGYIIELIGEDGAVVASSETVAVDNGDLKEATVRISGAESVRALYDNNSGPTAATPVQTAADTGVTNTIAPTQTVSAF